MARYVDVDDISSEIINSYCGFCLGTDCTKTCIITNIVKTIKEANADEVVRCKDCKHWKEITNGNWEHEPYCEWAGWLIGGNGYCVYGERKEE